MNPRLDFNVSNISLSVFKTSSKEKLQIMIERSYVFPSLLVIFYIVMIK